VVLPRGCGCTGLGERAWVRGGTLLPGREVSSGAGYEEVEAVEQG